MRSRSLILGLAAALGAAGTALADAPDLSPVVARVEAALADGSTPRAARAQYRALSKRLARADRPGLADEFSKLGAVAAAARGRLASDAALAAALRDALRGAIASLDAAAGDVVVAALDVDPGTGRSRIEAIVRRGRVRAESALEREAAGSARSACVLGKSAAKTFTAAASLVVRLVGQQDRRPPTWRVVLDDRAGALLSVHASAEGPVYAVGAHDTDGPQFLRGGPEGWVRVPVGDGAGDVRDLWWVDGVPGAGVWTCGSGGAVHTYDPGTGAVTSRPVGHDVVLYGVWGSGPDDVWAVGEDPDTSGPLPAAFHWDGAAWSPATLPDTAAGVTIYKVWGGAADDVWACGRQGLLLRFDGAAWTVVDSGTSSSLLTVHGASPAVAVGLAPVIAERGADGTWATVGVPAGADALNGVRVGADGDAWAVGYFRTVLRRTPRGWAHVADAPAAAGRDYHAVTIDAAGGVWIAGGQLTSLTDGSLLHFGTRPFGTDVLPRADTARVREIFNRSDSCAQAACHAPPFLSEELDLETAEGLRGRLLDVRSRQSPLPLIRPGRPSASYLWRKVSGTHVAAGGYGDRMPLGEEPLTAPEMDALRAWILEGGPGE